MWRDKKGNAMIVVLCVLSVVIILGLSMAAISSNSRAATIKNQHNQQAYYTARSVLDGVVTMLTEKGAAENIASGLDTELGNPKQLIAEGSLQGVGSYRVTLALTAPVEYIIVQEPDLDSEGEQKTDEDGQLLYHEKRAVSRLPLKITVTSKYKDSAAMVSAYLDGTPVLGQAADGGSNLDKISGDVDPQVQNLFQHIIGVSGTIGNMVNVEIEGDMYSAGGIGELVKCEVEGNMYTGGSIANQTNCDIKGDLYAKGSTGWINGGKLTGNIYAGGSCSGSYNDGVHQGQKYPYQSNLPLPTLAVLNNWSPAAPVKALSKVIDASKGPVYIQTSASEISNLTIKGTYPVYIQVTGTTELKLSSSKGAITGAKDTQVFYLCSDTVQNVTIGPTNPHDDDEGKFYGYVYAPKAQITIDAKREEVEIKGALVGSSLTVNNNNGKNEVELEFKEPKGNHPGSMVPVPGTGGQGSGGDSGTGGETEDDEQKEPSETDDKVLEGYTWQLSGYEGGRSDG